MSLHAWIRAIHRWASIAFTLTVAGIFATLAVTEPVEWAYYLPLPLLGLQLLTGLSLFALPYFTGQRDTARSQVAE